MIWALFAAFILEMIEIQTKSDLQQEIPQGIEKLSEWPSNLIVTSLERNQTTLWNFEILFYISQLSVEYFFALFD